MNKKRWGGRDWNEPREIAGEHPIESAFGKHKPGDRVDRQHDFPEFRHQGTCEDQDAIDSRNKIDKEWRCPPSEKRSTYPVGRFDKSNK